MTQKTLRTETIRRCLNESTDACARAAALVASAGRDDVSLEVIEREFVNNKNWRVQTAVTKACRGRHDIPLEWIEKRLNGSDPDVRLMAVNACAGRDDAPLKWIEKRLEDSSGDVRTAAVNVCVGRDDVPLQWIKKRLNDIRWTVRTSAINVCVGRDDIPLEWIQKGLEDSDEDVRLAAMRYFKTRNLPIPLVRTFEPPAVVYKKCLNDVIVCAEIPADAQVRGAEGHKCRANKAKIIDIIGDFYGEKVGISTFQGSTLYFVGDEIEIEDFDCEDVECSTGFHFFCTKEEAENY